MDELTIIGLYEGKNLFVQNPVSGTFGFCARDVTVNGHKIAAQVNSPEFEIDFGTQNLSPGDEVKVIIYHQDTCTPKILNPEVLRPLK